MNIALKRFADRREDVKHLLQEYEANEPRRRAEEEARKAEDELREKKFARRFISAWI
jgi:hypothetical protein